MKVSGAGLKGPKQGYPEFNWMGNLPSKSKPLGNSCWKDTKGERLSFGFSCPSSNCFPNIFGICAIDAHGQLMGTGNLPPTCVDAPLIREVHHLIWMLGCMVFPEALGEARVLRNRLVMTMLRLASAFVLSRPIQTNSL